MGWTRQKAECDDHRVRSDGFLTVRDNLGNAPAAQIGRTEARLYQLHTLHAVGTDDFNRLPIEQERNAFLLAVLVVATRTRHVLFIAPVGAGDARRTLPNGSAVAIHPGIAAAEHDHVLVAQVDEFRGAIADLQFAVDVRDQIGQRFVHPRQVFAAESAFDVPIGAHAEKYGIKLFHDLAERDVPSDLPIQAKFHAHAFHDLAALLHHVFFELERRYAEGEQSADLGIAIEDDGRDAIAHQDIGARQACGAGTDDRHALVRAHDVRQIGLPPQPERFVRDVLLDGADADGAKAVVERAGAFAKPILRADAPAHLGQRIGLMRELRRLEQFSLVDQRQPVGNVVVDRTLPLAEGIAARQAAAGLGGGRLGAVLRIDLAKLLDAQLDGELFRLAPRNVQKLQVLVGHGESGRTVSLRRAAQIDQQRVDCRRFGLHHPESADVGAEVIEQLRFPKRCPWHRRAVR